jgi:hypothetical protein
VVSVSSCRSTIMQQLSVDHGVNQENYEAIDLGSLGIIKTETKRASMVHRRRRTWTRWWRYPRRELKCVRHMEPDVEVEQRGWDDRSRGSTAVSETVGLGVTDDW